MGQECETLHLFADLEIPAKGLVIVEINPEIIFQLDEAGFGEEIAFNEVAVEINFPVGELPRSVLPDEFVEGA